MERTKTDVLVVGAGPVGLFCANELLRHGLNVRIIDKKEGLSDKSKALGLHIRTLDVMDDCDFLKEILSQGQRVEGAIFNSRGKPLFEVNFNGIGSKRNYLIDLPQNQTETIFYQRLLSQQMPVAWQTELVSFSQSSLGVKATIKDKDGNTEEIKADWLMACDGSHSTLRHLVNESFQGAAYEQTWWLADVHIDWAKPQNKMLIYVNDRGPLACFPMGETRYRVVMTAPPAFSGELTLDDIVSEFKIRSLEAFTLSNPLWLSQFTIHHRQIQNYRHGRVFFAGDAAHIHSPMGGQGLNTGIQDIYNLVWKLAMVQRGLAKDELLDSYQAERHPIGEQVLKKTDLMTRMILLRNPVLISLRNAFARLMVSLKPVRKAIARDLAELTISYAKSPIVYVQGAAGRLKIGEYIGDFSLMDEQRGSQETGPTLTRGTRHHLFVFCGQNPGDLTAFAALLPRLAERVQAFAAVHAVVSDTITLPGDFPSTYIDPGFSLHKRFDLEHETAVLVRPDKYVGFIQSPIHEADLLTAIRRMGIIC